MTDPICRVPLDWGAREKGLIPLSVIRLPATQPRQGYMFFNPGLPLNRHVTSQVLIILCRWTIRVWTGIPRWFRTQASDSTWRILGSCQLGSS
jgi:hypothetical protein